jgi:hypothetical protein
MLCKANKKDLFESLPDKYKKVFSVIGEGSDNPTTVKTIITLTGFNDVSIRKMVSDMRKMGIRIGTSNRRGKCGYYKIQNFKELQDTVRNLKGRAIEILQVARALEQLPDDNQQTLDI